MPAFVYLQGSSGRTGQPTDALLCSPSATGFPDRHGAVPVRIQRLSERVLSIDGEAHAIIACTGANGTTTFLVNGSPQAVRNRERRIALAKALAQLQQLATTLKPLRATSTSPSMATEGLGFLFDWPAWEREYAEGGDDAR